MRIEYLKSFLEISKQKSISKAAQSLYISQPTLSNQMRSLEEYLNLKLIKRSWSGVTLTKDGLLFLPLAIELLNKLDRFKKPHANLKKTNNISIVEDTKEINTTFKIGIDNFLVSKYAKAIIQSLSNQFPYLDFDIITASTDQLLQQKEHGTLDYMVYFNDDNRLQNTELINYEKIIIILNNNDFLIVNNNKETFKKTLYLNHNFKLNEPPSCINTLKSCLYIDRIILIDSISLMKTLIEEGQGFSIIPESFYDNYFNNKLLHKLHIANNIGKIPIYSTCSTTNDEFKTCACYLNNILRQI